MILFTGRRIGMQKSLGIIFLALSAVTTSCIADTHDGASKLGKLRDKDYVVTNGWQAVEKDVKAAISSSSVDVKGEIQSVSNTLSAAITEETTRAKAAEQANAKAISDEVTRAKAAEEANAKKIGENATAISNEVARAKEAEQKNASAISTEEARAKKAESDISSALSSHTGDKTIHITAAERTKWNDAVTGLTTEIARAKEAEGAISANLTKETDRAKAAESANATAIKGVASDVVSVSNALSEAISTATPGNYTTVSNRAMNAILRNVQNVDTHIDLREEKYTSDAFRAYYDAASTGLPTAEATIGMNGFMTTYDRRSARYGTSQIDVTKPLATSNATYILSFPEAAGTLALTDDVDALKSEMNDKLAGYMPIKTKSGTYYTLYDKAVINLPANGKVIAYGADASLGASTDSKVSSGDEEWTTWLDTKVLPSGVATHSEVEGSTNSTAYWTTTNRTATLGVDGIKLAMTSEIYKEEDGSRTTDSSDATFTFPDRSGKLAIKDDIWAANTNSINLTYGYRARNESALLQDSVILGSLGHIRSGGSGVLIGPNNVIQKDHTSAIVIGNNLASQGVNTFTTSTYSPSDFYFHLPPPYAQGASEYKSLQSFIDDSVSAADETLLASSSFSNAVLSVGLNIDTNSVAVLNEIASTFGGFPIEGTATTVGGLLAALAAAITWLKKNKAGKDEVLPATKQEDDSYKVSHTTAFDAVALADGSVGAEEIGLSPANNGTTLSLEVIDGKTNKKSALKADGSDFLTKTAGDAAYVPTSRTINGKALTADITLSASSIDALPVETYTGGRYVVPSIYVSGNLEASGSLTCDGELQIETVAVSTLKISNAKVTANPDGAVYFDNNYRERSTLTPDGTPVVTKSMLDDASAQLTVSDGVPTSIEHGMFYSIKPSSTETTAIALTTGFSTGKEDEAKIFYDCGTAAPAITISGATILYEDGSVKLNGFAISGDASAPNRYIVELKWFQTSADGTATKYVIVNARKVAA